MSARAVVLLSGGQDSATCLFWAKQRWDEVHTVNIAYGQRHASELEAASSIAGMAGAPYILLSLPVLEQLGDSALIGATSEITGSGGYADTEMPEGLPTSFVPCRNVLMLTIAAAYAVKIGAKDVVTGVCQTDYSGYPDCRRPFVDALEGTLTAGLPSSVGPIQIHTPLMELTKAETVQMAHDLGNDCWSAVGRSVTCYNGQHPGCRECPACDLRIAGFGEAGLVDPAEPTC